jgi:hypothetical protein
MQLHMSRYIVKAMHLEKQKPLAYTIDPACLSLIWLALLNLFGKKY